jgi:hypothetical protein
VEIVVAEVVAPIDFHQLVVVQEVEEFGLVAAVALALVEEVLVLAPEGPA